MHKAALRGEMGKLEEVKDVNERDKKGRTLLHSAVEGGSVEALELLLRRNADVMAQDVNGDTALMVAVKLDQREVLERLLEFKQDVAVVADNKGGLNALHWAVRMGIADVVRILLTRWESLIGSYTKESKSTPLHIACDEGSDPDVVAVLLEFIKRHDIKLLEAENAAGMTPLLLAGSSNNTDLLSTLIEAGCDPLKRTSNEARRTLLGLAAENGSSLRGSIPPEVLKTLARAAPDGLGKTPLHYAAVQGHDDLVKELIGLGVDPSVKDNDGKTAEELLPILLIDDEGDQDAPAQRITAASMDNPTAANAVKSTMEKRAKKGKKRAVDSEGPDLARRVVSLQELEAEYNKEIQSGNKKFITFFVAIAALMLAVAIAGVLKK